VKVSQSYTNENGGKTGGKVGGDVPSLSPALSPALSQVLSQVLSQDEEKDASIDAKEKKGHKSVCILQKVILFSGIRERCNWGNDVATIHGFFFHF